MRKGDVFACHELSGPEYRGATYVVVASETRRAAYCPTEIVVVTVLLSNSTVETWSAAVDDAYMPDVLLWEGER